MPTYRNDGAVSYKVYDKDDNVVVVPPGASVETLENPEIADFTQTASTPTNEVTIGSAPGASGIFTDPVKVNEKGYLNISVFGESAWEAIVTLQRSFDGGSNYVDFDTFTVNYQDGHTDHEPNVLYRIGVKNGDWTSGDVTVRLSK